MATVFWDAKGVILLDILPQANLTQQWLQRYGWETLPHPAHSPDLAPSDFHLFGPLKRHLGGMAFETEDDLISELRNWFDNLDVDFSRVEYVSATEESHLQTVVSITARCLDIVLSAVDWESGLQKFFISAALLRVALHQLLLVVFLACPILSVDSTWSQLAKYVVREQDCASLNKSSGEETNRRKKSLKQQREESGRQHEEMSMVELSLIRKENGEEDIRQTGPSDESSPRLLDKSEDDFCHSPQTVLMKDFWQKTIEAFKSKLMVDCYSRLVLTFCSKSYSDKQVLYDSLRKAAASPAPSLIGRHQLSSLFLSEQVFPLLWYLAQQNDPPDSCLDHHSRKPQELLSQLEKIFISFDKLESPAQEVMIHIRAQEKVFPSQIFWLHQSEADMILASGRELGGEEDLSLLSRTVKKKEHGWRELLGRGLLNSDFQGWWKKGFLKLFWANEASLATEQNVIRMLSSLCQAVQSQESGLCDRVVVEDIRKLLSVMFKRLPTVLQESIVLQHLDLFDTSQKRISCSSSPEAENLPANDADSADCHIALKKSHGFKAASQKVSPLSLVMTEEEVACELTVILNRLTLANADQLMPSLLYLCLFNISLVLQHLVLAAITTNGQTESVVQVLRNKSALCKLTDPHTKCYKLVSSVLEEVHGMELEGKQAQNIVQLLTSVIQPYTLTLDTSATRVDEKMEGILSLPDILHSFIFASFGPQISCVQPRVLIDSELVKANAREEQREQTVIEADSSDTKSEENVNAAARQETWDVSDEENLKKCLPLDVALATLEVLLQKAVEEEAFSYLEFQPLALLVALCDCYSENYNVLVTTAGDLGGIVVSARRKTLRLASRHCLSLLLRLVKSNWNAISDVNVEWLQHEMSKRGWLHMALLSPVLTEVEGWSNIYSKSLDALCQAIKDDPGKSTRRLVHLMQLCLVNDAIFQIASDKLLLLKETIDGSNLMVAVKWILLSAVPTEMGCVVHIIRLLHTEESIKASQSVTDAEDDTSRTEPWPVIVCEKLVDAALLLDADTEAESLRCHALANYQAALQTLTDLVSPAESTFVLSKIFCMHCILLSVTSGQAALILQVTAMDILSKLKLAMKDRKRRRGGSGVKVASRLKENRELQDVLGTVSDCISCVQDVAVQNILSKQFKEMAV
ncbi:histone-lysine N-methyltransferase SETMAR [Plakobranchus ocellatus]|uniref:Histone-lysine N-methyltransferase SETMAR n=1 Tax=Plakobranchus ocellatus TaxID=259542 RepID=A0AAV3YF68_9GAST|nr:histone-lysine N-methyltransferase SETMAR [Plakobranchus ocellatus]